MSSTMSQEPLLLPSYCFIPFFEKESLSKMPTGRQFASPQLRLASLRLQPVCDQALGEERGLGKKEAVLCVH